MEDRGQALREMSANIDKVNTFIGVPSIINQCLHSGSLIRAIQVIRHFEGKMNAGEGVEKNKVLKCIEKEVGVLK